MQFPYPCRTQGVSSAQEIGARLEVILGFFRGKIESYTATQYVRASPRSPLLSISTLLCILVLTHVGKDMRTGFAITLYYREQSLFYLWCS